MPVVLNRLKHIVFIIIAQFITYTSQAAIYNSSLEKCLFQSRFNVAGCFEQQRITLNSQTCFQKAAEIKSLSIKENLNEFCFFDLTEFKNLDDCLEKTSRFQQMDNHDNAVFLCRETFEKNINKNSCFKISKMLRHPEKKTYLEDYCHTL